MSFSLLEKGVEHCFAKSPAIADRHCHIAWIRIKRESGSCSLAAGTQSGVAEVFHLLFGVLCLAEAKKTAPLRKEGL